MRSAVPDVFPVLAVRCDSFLGVQRTSSTLAFQQIRPTPYDKRTPEMYEVFRHLPLVFALCQRCIITLWLEGRVPDGFGMCFEKGVCERYLQYSTTFHPAWMINIPGSVQIESMILAFVD